MLEWLIVGSGVHGTHLSHQIMNHGGVHRDRIRVLDPHPVPLARWDTLMARVGVAYLRSPVVHHLDAEPWSLKRFARRWRSPTGLQPWITRYKRPSVELFRAHVDALSAASHLDALRLEGRAIGIRRMTGGLRVETTGGPLEARRVVLALGSSESPLWPEWARRLGDRGGEVGHVFDADFAPLPSGARVAVLGGGSTAAQTALAFARTNPGAVTLLSRHAPRLSPFDTDHGWMGPRQMGGFWRERSLSTRRILIRQARRQGSCPPEVASSVRAAFRSGTLDHRLATVTDADLTPEGAIQLDFGADAPPILVDRLVLATGFDPARPGGDWLGRAIQDLGLPCAPCGFPIVDRRLQWQDGLFVSGALAELEVGPVARNILGARVAAERLRHSA